jgi:hypothetical protein
MLNGGTAMSEGSSGKAVFRELELQNPAIAYAFRALRRPRAASKPSIILEREASDGSVLSPANPPNILQRRAEYREYSPARMSRSFIAPILLLVGIGALAIAVGPAVGRFLALYWQAVVIPAGAMCIGAGIVLLVGRLGAAPLRNVDPPQLGSDDPLKELKQLAERTASRLRTAYRLQLWAVLAVGGIFLGLVIWSMVLVSQDRILYASAFGSGSVAMLVLTRWKWQPFDRINQARRLADNADTLATGLRLRMSTISEITDPSERARAQWDAVGEYLDRS